MRHIHQLVFDEYIMGTTAVTTSQELNSKLGQYDQIGLFVVADNVTGTTPTLSYVIMHSGDGRNWVEKNVGTGAFDRTTPTLSTTGVNVDQFLDSNVLSKPALGLVQVKLALAGGGTLAAHVKLYFTARDQGGR